MNIFNNIKFEYVFMRGFGYSGTGAIIDWLLSDNSFHINKNNRLIELNPNRYGYEISKFLNGKYNNKSINLIRFKLFFRIPLMLLYIPLKGISEKLISKFYPKLLFHKSHSIDNSLRTLIVNFIFSFRFYPIFLKADFEKWFLIKNKIKSNDKIKIIFDQAIPYDREVFNLIKSKSISILVYRNPINIIKQRVLVEQKTLDIILKGPNYKKDLNLLSIDKYYNEIESMLSTLKLYHSLAMNEISVIPINFDNFISNGNFQKRFAKLIGINPNYDFNESIINNQRLNSIKYINNDSKILDLLIEIMNIYNEFDKLFADRVLLNER